MDRPTNRKTLHRPVGCGECLNGADLGFDFTMAFQPIVNVATGEIFAHEALVRGVNQENAGEVFRHVNDANRYRFDQVCRVKAVELASHLRMPTVLSINFMPKAVYQPELCIRTTLQAAEKFAFPVERLLFEVTESEKVEDVEHLKKIIRYYKELGIMTAIDDFGAGYSGLNFIAGLQTDFVKLDMELIRDIDKHKNGRIVVNAVIRLCGELGIRVVAEGIETYAELAALRDLGVELFQGFYLARPAFESLASVPESLWRPSGP